MGKVQEIFVENFKSYQGRVQIGPFRHFTCVVGPNGAGKSNLMDAISFVLGVQAKVLRSDKLRDLVYRREGEDPKKNQRTASVELVYVGDSASPVLPISDGPCQFPAAELQPVQPPRIVFKRIILKGGEARFQLDGETVSQADYNKRLESINILSKVRNFLVFQGDVEAVAQRQGKELTAFFEQISGSEAFKSEYERLAAEKARTEDTARYLFTKKRNAINDKKRVANQKQEADEYQQLAASRRDLEKEFVLFRLHGLTRQQEDTKAAILKLEGERQEVQGEITACKEKVEKAEQAKAQAHLKTSQAERELAAARVEADKLNPERVAVQTRLNFLRLRLEDLQQDVVKTGKKRERLSQQVESLKQERDALETEQKALVERLQQRELKFTPQQHEQFELAKQAAEKITTQFGSRLRTLELQIRAVTAERARAEHEQREVDALAEHLSRKVAELQDAVEAARLRADASSEKARQCYEHQERLQSTHANVLDEKDQLLDERQRLLDTIQDIAATERELNHERELARICSNLANAVPGVYGRVLDLCRPSQKRLHVAVNVALGKFVDAVVVDTGATARRCVRYLKDNMLAPVTFLPLNELRLSQRHPRLDELVASTSALRLALNCLSFDERVAKAFEFLLSDVVIADTMADGRRLAFGEAQALGVSCKIVTLAGEAIAKNGNLSVNSEATREGATRFDLSEIDAAKNRLEAVGRQISALHSSEASASSEILASAEEARRCEAKAAESAAHLKYCQNALNQKVDELRSAEARRSQTNPEVQRLTKIERELLEEQRRIETHLSHHASGLFADLSAAMGVDDVQRAEREWRREREAGQARADELARRIRNVLAELTMLERSLSEQAGQCTEQAVPKIEAEVAQLTQKLSTLSTDVEGAIAEATRRQERFESCAEEERGRERVVLKFRQRARELKQTTLELEKRAADLESETRRLNDQRTDVLRQSVLDDVEVPLIEGGFEALQDIAEASTQPVSVPTEQGAACDASAAAICIDFSALPSEKKAASVGPAARMLESEYLAELERLKGELQRLSPNLKADEQLQEIAAQVQTASHEADLARREIEDIAAQFEAVRRERKERFMACFSKVSEEIKEVYRRLTSYTAGLQCDGGAAFLDLEDMEDPFNGGIKFTAMPPAKRFRDMHLLSGGEKTLASMALLFAVHAYHAPPFMVLDEVDAALDANNVQALANYVQQMSVQTIVISLKDRFFVKSEALIGVWKNKPEETSAILTLDLTQYPVAAV